MTDTPDWLLTHLSSHKTPREATEGLLFHGTVEPFDTPLHATGWEQLLWFAESPEIAQSYCPESGSDCLVSFPRYALQEKFIPHGDMSAMIFALMGYDIADMDAERDEYGRMCSYRLVDNHPTNAEAKKFVESLGYTFEDESCWIKMRLKDEGGDEIMPADWRIPGRLYILERPKDLKLYDLQSTADGGLTGCQWMRTDLFEKLAASGTWDGIVVDDINQSKKMGHFNHRSIGLFQPTIERLRFHIIDCVNAEPWDIWQATDGHTTPEFDALYQEARKTHKAAA